MNYEEQSQFPAELRMGDQEVREPEDHITVASKKREAHKDDGACFHPCYVILLYCNPNDYVS